MRSPDFQGEATPRKLITSDATPLEVTGMANIPRTSDSVHSFGPASRETGGQGSNQPPNTENTLTSRQEAGLRQIRAIDKIVNEKILSKFITADP